MYIAPIQWGDGGEVVVIGVPRHTKQWIEVVMRRDYITNFRIKRVYSPTLLRIMHNSEFLWWIIRSSHMATSLRASKRSRICTANPIKEKKQC